MNDVVIIGGGVIGCAIAYFLKADTNFNGNITVIERDTSYRQASSALSASSIRQQFSTAVNIEISKFGIQFLRQVDQLLATEDHIPDIGLVEPGYLFLATSAGAQVIQENHRLQLEHGANILLLDPLQLKQRFPWLNTDDLAWGSWGADGEGWFDGYMLLQAFRKKARSQGVNFINAEVVQSQRNGNRIEKVMTQDGTQYHADIFVNAAGPWAAQVAKQMGIALPVHARRRCVFVFSTPTPLANCPLVIDPSGVYFRPEGNQYICGISPDEANDLDDLPLEVDYNLFEEIIWPTLATRVPSLETLRQTHAWAGYYEYNNFDCNGLVGSFEELENVIFANGFSGHGIQQAPGVGRGIAELITYNSYRTLDLSQLSPMRILMNKPLLEKNVV